MDGPLQKIKELIYAEVEYDVANTDDAWGSNRLLPLYLQLKILDMLDSIDSRLISVEDEISKLNPMYK